ncbi:MAG: hypothetical protein AAF664_00030 [Planctomycetota bacterium]
MHRCFTVLGLLAALSASTEHALGAVSVSLTPSIAAISSSGGTVTFTGSIDGDPGDALVGYDLFIDIVGLDLDDAGPISITNQVPLTAFDLPSTTLPADGRDIGFGGANLFSVPIPIDAPTDLFSFDAVFSALPIGQTFDFEFDTQAIGSGITVNGSDLDLSTDVAFSGGSVTVIPEPSPALALGLVIFHVALRVRRRCVSKR